MALPSIIIIFFITKIYTYDTYNTPQKKIGQEKNWSEVLNLRYRPDLNRRIGVLQTPALPLGYGTRSK